MSSKKPLAKPVSTQKTDLAALRKASKLPLANPDKQEEEKLLSDVAAEEAQDTPVQLAAAPSTVVSDASPAGAHSVGDAHAAHAAQPASQASGMGALSSNWLLGAAGFGLVAAAASGGGGGGSSPAATPTPSQQGTAIDGYVVGADVYLDTNNNHQLDAGDTKVGTTGKGGTFSVSNPNKLDVFVKGGFNDSNQNGTKDAGELDNTVVLKATGGTSGNFIVSPLTTLVQELLRQSPQTTQKAAESTIKAALGLDQAIDLTSFDPLAAGNTANALAAYKAAVQVATALDIAADEQAFLQALVSKLTANTTPGASGILVSSITAAFTSSTDNNVTSTELLNKLELIGSATSIGNITESQAQVNNDKEVAKPQFSLNSDTGSSNSDRITSDHVMNVTLADDVASWKYSLDGGETWKKGSGTSFNLADNATYAAGDIQVRQVDKAGNISDIASNKNIITVDTTVAAPTFALATDTGVSEGDGITSNGLVKVDLAQDVASWEYSLKGADWVKGTGTSFNLADNATYEAGDIQVRQTDKAGNLSEAFSNEAAIIVDTTVAAPTFALATDTGISEGDGITSNGLVKVDLAQDVASWEYSLKGADWVKGTGTSFNLADNATYEAGDIQVRQVDKAGNISDIASNKNIITVDTTVAAPTFALATDTGVSEGDGITSNGLVKVDLANDVASWKYSVDGGETWNVGEGDSFTLANYLHFGAPFVGGTTYASGDILVSQTDKAGNISEAAINLADITVDTTVAAPTFALRNDTGVPAEGMEGTVTDGITSDNVVVVSNLEQGATWQYSLDGGKTWNNGEGSDFSLKDNTIYLVDDIQVRQTDKAGNTSQITSNEAQIQEDSTVEEIVGRLNSDTGIPDDGITNDNVVNLTLAPDVASWEYSLDGGKTWNKGSGTSFNLADNATYAAGDIQAYQVDKAGNISELSFNLGNWTVDTTVATPTFALVTDTGISEGDGITSNGLVKVDLAQDVASWKYSVDGGETWNDGEGDSFTLANNTTYVSGNILVSQTDKAGNISEAAINLADITVDTTVAAPTFALRKDTGVPAEGMEGTVTDGITNDNVVVVSNLEQGATWQYSLDGGNTWNDGEGSSFSLTDNSTYAAGAIQVRQTDKAGNLSEAFSNTALIQEDSAVAKPAFALNSDSGTASDFITNDNVVNVTLAQDVASWEYSLDGGVNWTVGTGTSFNLADNTSYAVGAVQVRQTDKAGNLSEAFSNTALIQEDSAVAKPAFALNSDSGAASDFVTNDNVVNVTLAQDVASWEYSLDGGVNWTVGTGTSFNLADNTSYAVGAVQVRQTDKAGNLSEAFSNTALIQEDSAVAKPAFALNSDSGAASDFVTNDNVVNVTLAQDVASWEYSLDGGVNWTVGTGTSFNLADNTSYAVGTVQVRQTDKAGNLSEAFSNTSQIIEDSLAAAPTVALSNDTGASSSDKVTSSAALTVTATEPGALVEYTLDSGTHWLNQQDYNAAVANDGNYTVAVRQTDMAGNVSAASTPLAFTLSKAVPAAAISGVQFLERMELGAQDAEYVLKVEGSNMRSLLTGSAVAGDVSAQLDFSKLSWKLDGSNTVSLASGIEKAEVISDTEMWLHLTVAQYQALVASGALLDSVDRVSDSLVIDSGFLVSASGVANTAHYTESALGSVYQLELNGTPDTPPLVYASQIELSGSGKFATDNAQTPALDITVSGSGTVEVSVLGSKATDLVFDAHQTGGSITLNLDALAVGGDGGLVQNSGTGELTVYLNDNVNQVAMEGSMTIYQAGEGGNITLGAGSQHVAVYEDRTTDLNLSGFETDVDKIVLDVDFLNAQFGVQVFTPGQQLSDFTNLNDGILNYDANTGVLTLDADGDPGTTNITLLQFEAGTQLQTSDFLVAKIV